jgi:hypothetical protein
VEIEDAFIWEDDEATWIVDTAGIEVDVICTKAEYIVYVLLREGGGMHK